MALAGRLASMSREDFIEIVECHGGGRSPSGDGMVFVLGQRDLPLQPAGTFPRNYAGPSKVMKDDSRDLTEDAFLEGWAWRTPRGSTSSTAPASPKPWACHVSGSWPG